MINIKCVLCGSEDYKVQAKGHDRYIAVDNTVFTLVKCDEYILHAWNL